MVKDKLMGNWTSSLATTSAYGATVLHHAPGAVGHVTAAGGSQQQQPKFVFNVDAAAPNGRSADVDSVTSNARRRTGWPEYDRRREVNKVKLQRPPFLEDTSLRPVPLRHPFNTRLETSSRSVKLTWTRRPIPTTVLPQACAGGNEELVELLISRGTNIEHKDKKGFTPLILIATTGHEKVVETLLRHEAKIEAQSERTKDTPLSLACSVLLNMNANRENRNVPDYTPLSLATSGGYLKNIKLLLSHGTE
ncbi:conserved hypothetical protein [Culex quinquefasciatus]|uniref:Uncharacterized protein n=1 Tax=Culex quinquefasciatus TaxID=7176 RepID=B0XH84_CULQU|nr:conserved hypothetical protein [Culex quinquefasciatus]|eukprot:XP_001869006.1 conserved hypothetical protein [Culex quinquefasciatus]